MAAIDDEINEEKDYLSDEIEEEYSPDTEEYSENGVPPEVLSEFQEECISESPMNKEIFEYVEFARADKKSLETDHKFAAEKSDENDGAIFKDKSFIFPDSVEVE